MLNKVKNLKFQLIRIILLLTQIKIGKNLWSSKNFGMEISMRKILRGCLIQTNTNNYYIPLKETVKSYDDI